MRPTLPAATLLLIVAACTPVAPFETSRAVLVDENQDPFGSATSVDVQVHYFDGGESVLGTLDPISGEQQVEGLREGVGAIVDIVARDAGGAPVAMGRSQPFDIGPEGGAAAVFVGEVDSLARVAGGLSAGRAFAAGAYVPGGRVVVVGGGDNDSTPVEDIEFIGWDAVAPVIGVAGSSFPRLGHQITYVPLEVGGPHAGHVLSLGGTPEGGTDTLEGAWQFSDGVIASIDPVSGEIDRNAGELATSDALAQLVWTKDDRIALIGGFNSTGQYFDAVRLVDPTDLSTEAGPNMETREQHRLSELSVSGNRMALISGGTSAATGPRDSLVLWDLDIAAEPDTLDGIVMSEPRVRHTSTALSSGRVLLAGGSIGNPDGPFSEYDRGESTRTADIFDPVFRSVTATGTDMVVARQRHVAAALGDDEVLVCAGETSDGAPLGSCEVYDDSDGTGTWTPFTGGAMSPGGPGVTAVPLPDGRVLFFGGVGAAGPDDSVYVYTPTSLGPP